MSELTGKWNVLTKTPIGDTKAVWIIEVENGNYSGSINADGVVTPWESIIINGNTFKMKITLNAPFGLIDLVMEGEYSENEDTFSGIASMKMGKSKFKGKRA